MAANNHIFRFKQFEVKQEKSAMKICTDSCVFGAVVNPEASNFILDIGTGTGLLALMMAQKTNAQIDAIEIDADASDEARYNFFTSPWSDRLKLIQSSIQNYSEVSPIKYDFIISNPPFFSDNLKSSGEKRNIAMHSESLSQQDFVIAVKKLLSAKGYLAVLLPPFEADQLEKRLTVEGLFPHRYCFLKNNRLSNPIRKISTYGTSKLPEISISEIIIRNEVGDYSHQFQTLLKDYYIIF